MKNNLLKKWSKRLIAYSHVSNKFIKLTLVMLVLHVIINNVNAQNIGKVNENDKVYSDAFKAKLGTNRLVEFKKLESLLIPKTSSNIASPNADYFIGEFAMKQEELILLLGQPDVKISNITYQYNLGGISSICKLYVGITDDGYISYSVLKSCN